MASRSTRAASAVLRVLQAGIVSIFVLVASESSAEVSASLETHTESLLRERGTYLIAPEEDVPTALFQRVRSYYQQIETKDGEPCDEEWLALGDAFHWLGHIFDDHGERLYARLLYEQSLDAYRASRIRKSDRIRGLNGAEHAIDHLHASRLGLNIYDYLDHKLLYLPKAIVTRVKEGGIDPDEDPQLGMLCHRLLKVRGMAGLVSDIENDRHAWGYRLEKLKLLFTGAY